MKKIILFVGALVVLSGCSKEIAVENVKDKIAEKAQEGLDAVSVNTCLEGCAVMNGDGLFSRETCEGSCWADEAKNKKDVKICDEKIAKENGIPKTACYMNVAEETGDPTHCDKIADKKDLMVASCYASVAKKYKKAELCEGIKETLLYDPCVADASAAE